jgi:hypothetical protein
MREDYGVDISTPMLMRLSYDGRRILSVSRLKNGNFLLMELCDQYFWEEFTPEELAALGAELIAAAKGG